MSRQLAAGRVWRMTCFADVHSFAEHEAVGATTQELRAILADEFARYGSDVVITGPDVSRRTVGSDTLSVIVQVRPSAELDTDNVALSVLSALNKPSRRAGADGEEAFDGFVPHTPAAYTTLALLVLPVALPFALGATVANYAADGARANGVEVPRPFSFVVDESTITEGPTPAGTVPPATSTFVGSVLSSTNTIASADRARDGRTNGSVGVERAETAIKTAADQGLANTLGIPGWVGPVAIAAGVLVAVVAVGYGARGVAQVLQET